MNGGKYDSFITYKKAYHNLNFIRHHGIEEFVERQRKRIKLLEIMQGGFNDGRSKSFYCIATTLLQIKDIVRSLDETKQKIVTGNVELNDVKTKAKILKEVLNEVAAREGIKSKLRKKT